MTFGFPNFGFGGSNAMSSYLANAARAGMNTANSLYGNMASAFNFGGMHTMGMDPMSMMGNFGSGFGINPMSMMGMNGMMDPSLASMNMVSQSGMPLNLIANSPYLSTDSKLAYIDAKYGSLFNMGLQMNPGQVMPQLWKAQASATNEYFKNMMAQQQQQQQAPGGLMGMLGQMLGGEGGGLGSLLSMFTGGGSGGGGLASLISMFTGGGQST